MLNRKWSLLLWITLAAGPMLALGGCGDSSSSVKQYQVAKVNDQDDHTDEATMPQSATPRASGSGPATSGNTPPAAAPGGGPVAPFANMSAPLPGVGQQQMRMLAAIVPAAQRTWFFKLVGPADEVAKVAKPFNTMIDSVTLSDEGTKADWKLPDGWQQTPGSGMRYATININAGGAKPLELTVVPLGPAAGSTLANVNRWRGQLGLPSVDESQLAGLVRHVQISGVDASVVDITSAAASGGNATAGATAPAPAAPAAGGEDFSQKPLTFDTPSGWTEQKAGGMRLVSMKSGDVDISVVVLPSIASNAMANINRWRGQLKLPPVGDEEIGKSINAVQVDGANAVYVDIASLPSESDRQRIIAAMVPRGPQVWFFKMMGPADQVEAQKAAFDKWLASVKFRGSGS